MNKTEKKIRMYAILVIFVLLTVLLAVINGLNFTMAAEDADRITKTIADMHGAFEIAGNPETVKPQHDGSDFKMGPMGPDSPEMNASIRFFTISFDKKEEKAETVAFRISAVTEDEAREWARGLIDERTGWTKGIYRYRVYERKGVKYVTVIDQGRELLPSYRTLLISVIGEILFLIIAWFLLLVIGRKIYSPIEEADRKQKLFISNANREFRIPLTVIDANTEIAERRYGPDDETRSTRRQLDKLNGLIEQLGTLGMIENSKTASTVPVSELMCAALERAESSFSSRGLSLTADITPGITLPADPTVIERMIGELIENSLKFAVSQARFSLKKDQGYALLETQNDADLPDGPADQVFDRFTTLSNAAGRENCAGIGLSLVKETVNH